MSIFGKKKSVKVLLQCSIGSIQCEKMNSSKKVYFSLYADTCCKPFVGGTFISFCGWIKDRKYIDEDINVVEIVIFRRAQFVCSHASHSSVSYTLGF